jgi:hypothetical protein
MASQDDSVTDPGEPPSLPAALLPKYPQTVRAAAILWIAAGAGALLNVAVVVGTAFGVLPGADEANTQVAILRATVGGLFQAIVGGVFLYEGIECFRGAIPNTIPISVGSFLLGLILVGIVFFVPEATRESRPVVLVLVAVGLLIAAVLGLLGGNQYERWWKARSRLRAKRPPERM